jgi:hypothetical protein
MRNRTEDIKNAGNADEIRELLEWMMSETERIISSQQLALDESSKIALYLTQIRLLLDELSSFEVRRGAADPATFLATGLVSRFLDLEGRVKEIRNDMLGSLRGPEAQSG